MGIDPVIHIQSSEHMKRFIEEEKLFLLYFSARECNVCHAVFPKLMSLVEDVYPIKVAKVDVKELVEIAGQFLVFTVPTTLLIYEGREILRESRFIDFQKVERTLDSLRSV